MNFEIVDRPDVGPRRGELKAAILSTLTNGKAVRLHSKRHSYYYKQMKGENLKMRSKREGDDVLVWVEAND